MHIFNCHDRHEQNHKAIDPSFYLHQKSGHSTEKQESYDLAKFHTGAHIKDARNIAMAWSRVDGGSREPPIVNLISSAQSSIPRVA